MKKIEYPNRGHLITDYFVDGISRVYEHSENIVITLESPTGLETPNAILKNECVRLIIPKSEFNKFHDDVVLIKEKVNFKEVTADKVVKESTKKDKSFLGSAFNISD